MISKLLNNLLLYPWSWICHTIFTYKGIGVSTNAEWWLKEQAKAAVGLWRRMLLRETWLPDIAIIQTMIAPRKGLSITITFNCMITVPWKSSFQVAGHSPHFFCFGHAECKLYFITEPYSNPCTRMLSTELLLLWLSRVKTFARMGQKGWIRGPNSSLFW